MKSLRAYSGLAAHGSQIESHLQFRYSTICVFCNSFNHFASRFHFNGRKFVFTNEDTLATCQGDIKCHATRADDMTKRHDVRYMWLHAQRAHLTINWDPKHFLRFIFCATQTETNVLSSPRTLQSTHFDGDFIMLNEIRYLVDVFIRQCVCVFVTCILLKHIFFFSVMYANSICSICLAATASTATLRDK